MVPTPMPHPYIGKLKDKLSSDVEIGGKKAAVKGSKAKFESPGHFPMPPGTSFQNKPNDEAEVTGGCCDKVKINGKDACVLGSTATSCDDTNAPDGCKIVAMGATVVLPIKMACIDDLTYQQDGGFMINTRQMEAPAYHPMRGKSPKLSSPQWGATTAKVGEEVTLEVNVSELYEGANIYFTIWKEGFDPAVDVPVAKLTGRNDGTKAVGRWKANMPNPDSDEDKAKFVFTAIAFKCAEVQSNALEVSRFILKITLKNSETGNLMPHAEYEVRFEDGSIRKGKLDEDACAIEKDVPDCKYEITFVTKKEEHEIKN